MPRRSDWRLGAGPQAVSNRVLPTFDPREEPGALAAHAGICAGGEEKSSSLPRPRRVQVLPGLLGKETFSPRAKRLSHRGLPAAAADIKRKAFGEVRIVRQKIQPFALHGAAVAARDAPHLEFQNNPKSRARQVANLPHPPVVPTVLDLLATAANRFFERRSRRNIRTSGSPNTPRRVSFARKPSNEYPSDRRRCRFPDSAISQHVKNQPASNPKKPLSTSIPAAMIPQNHPLDSLKTHNYMLTSRDRS